MTLQQVFFDAYLTRMASKVIHQSLIELASNTSDRQTLRENAELGLTMFESNGAPLDMLDELYLATL